MATTFSMTRTVEFAETDMAGIVHFTNFYRWMEVCEHEFLRSLGLSVDTHTVEGRVGWPRVKTSCRFKRPLRFEDEVTLTLTVKELRDRSIVYAFDFHKTEDGETILAAHGETIAACCLFDFKTQTLAPIPIPNEFLEKMTPSEIS
tara:strand:- start:107 stop:544 length:438 start_codon:yes stop_codon:yes gene_type:complete